MSFIDKPHRLTSHPPHAVARDPSRAPFTTPAGALRSVGMSNSIMANLEITPCSRETGRQRYRLSQRARIPYEYRGIPPPPAPAAATDAIAGGDTDTETFLGLDDSLPQGTSGTSHPEVEGGDDGDEDAAIVTAAGGHEEPHDESDEVHAPIFTFAGEHNDDVFLFSNEPHDESDEVGAGGFTFITVPHDESDEASAEGSNEDSSDEESDRDEFPAVSPWRLNLTALSQKYNLYFAAYGNSIHVSRPRSCVTHSLPAVPDLVLAPTASRAGLETIGAIDLNDGHQVNHLIIGLLGEAEILLMAYDDGDVIGYYTKPIEDTVGDSYSPVQKHDLTPFFHENVGRSAWGLAIHQRSRLIAVGSNAHAATVFMPALTTEPLPPSPKNLSPWCWSSTDSTTDNSEPESSMSGFPSLLPPVNPSAPGSTFYVIMKDETGRFTHTDLFEGETGYLGDVIDWATSRVFNLRIEMTTGDAGHNIPNLTFSSDEEGLASNIIAVDVLGNLWVMDLRSDKPHRRIPGIHRQRILRGVLGEPIGPMGWGVLSIPKSSFLPTKSFHDTLGLDEDDARYIDWRDERWIDISRGIHGVPNNSTVHRWSRWANTAFQREHSQLVEMHPWFGSHELLDLHEVLDIAPCEGWDAVEPPEGEEDEEWFLRDGSSVLRTYETDFELRPFEEGGVGIMYEHLMTQMRRPTLGPARLAMERIGTLLLVPELALVVGASMSGRVALVTLTCRETPAAGAAVPIGLKRGFKIEAILPTEKDEDKDLRPLCPLYGVAVGPLPQTLRGKMAGQNRYRLMIHYYDLSILSYEISRDPGTKELSVLAM